MDNDPTLPQDQEQKLRAQQRSLQAVRPPTVVPGYELEQLLGSGAYGEVWHARERNTGRRVAIKFYAHRGGLDWSLLSREVEKLTFLFADRHVVQLIGVGWDADPPYYVMEYLERGSLADRLHQEPLTCREAVGIFREVAVGLIHAHGRGVLHCDLKPGNVLLDQDNRPRLADFGQSRLFHEQAPALGTLFYMPPEQANLEAVPDVRWDVYALGALLYCMLTGKPPHRNEATLAQLENIDDFGLRLAEYRKIIRRSLLPTAHRQVRGVDRALAEIIERCLAPDPKQRFANVQAVLDALDARDARRARRPAMLLGTFGPALVLLVVSLFAWTGFSRTLARSEAELLAQALKTNRFAARSVAKAVAAGVERRCRAVESMVASEYLRREFIQAVNDPELSELSRLLSDPAISEDRRAALRTEFREHPGQQALQAALEAVVPAAAGTNGKVNSWFLNDARGVQIARAPEPSTVGYCYTWRSYFHGGPTDLDEGERLPPDQHIMQTGPSVAYQSKASGIWNVAVSTPIFADDEDGTFLGVGGLTVGIGDLMEPVDADATAQFAVLVEQPKPGIPGHILDHPVMTSPARQVADESDPLRRLIIDDRQFPESPRRKAAYRDPVGAVDPKYDRRWLAETADVKLQSRGRDWVVIVQESYDTAIGATLRELKAGLVVYGWSALAMVALVVLGLWGVAYRLLEQGESVQKTLFWSSDTETAKTTAGSSVLPGKSQKPTG
ncbi:MAG: serine/threonine protein kinase [Planctomycetaceae bacterium]|nr:serine/threonine protein kinase [Planctomycetaceae bacterium]